MTEIYYRMNSFDGVGIDAPNGDAIIVGSVGSSNELQVAIPLDDVPVLVALLSRGLAQANSGLAQQDLGTSLNANSPQLFGHPDQSKVTLCLELASGVSLAFGFPKADCADLRDQLDNLLD